MKFDELNRLKRFYSSMAISEQDKKTRVEFADLMYDAVVYALTMIKLEREIQEIFSQKKGVTPDNAQIAFEEHKESLQNRIYDVFESMDIPPDDDYIEKLADEIIDTTERNIDDEYYTSSDRALLIAQNEANTVYNEMTYKTAVSEGKQFKTWITQMDNRERAMHAEVDGVTIPINEYFHVGSDMMLFPHDFKNGTARNLINCRCVCVYS